VNKKKSELDDTVAAYRSFLLKAINETEELNSKRALSKRHVPLYQIPQTHKKSGE
jgi:hypothetical protein